MKEFKALEVQLRGRGFTLYPVCYELNVAKELAENILWAMHIAAETVLKEGFSTSKQMEIKMSNPVLPNAISKEHFRDENSINDCIAEGLLLEKDGKYEITEKMSSVLEGMIKKREELDASGFSYCPCNMYD